MQKQEKQEIQVKPFSLKYKASPWEVLQFQILACCHFNKIHNTPASHLELMALLSLYPDRFISSFAKEVADRGIFKSSQAARNAISSLIDNELILIVGDRGKYVIELNPAIKCIVDSNILLNFNILAVGTPEPPALVQDTGREKS